MSRSYTSSLPHAPPWRVAGQLYFNLPLHKVSIKSIPTRYFRNFSMFNFSPLIKNCPTRCVSAANVVCRDFDVFKTNIVSLSHLL
jgi:hypothetical protein